MRIPEIRGQLTELSRMLVKEPDVDLLFVSRKIQRLVRELYRRPAKRRAPRHSRPLTPKLKVQLARHAAKFPHVPYSKIGAAFGVEGARVSESYAGKRT